MMTDVNSVCKMAVAAVRATLKPYHVMDTDVEAVIAIIKKAYYELNSGFAHGRATERLLKEKDPDFLKSRASFQKYLDYYREEERKYPFEFCENDEGENENKNNQQG